MNDLKFTTAGDYMQTSERIKLLAEQAGWDNHHSKFDTRIKKFAQLIVLECTKILADNSEFRGCVIIGKHFGVE